MANYHVVILANEDPYDHLPWVEACEARAAQLSYRVVDLTRHDWLDRLREGPADFLLAKPSGKTSKYRDLYQERLDVLAKDLQYPIFPSLEAIRIYENKRFFAYWAQANAVPHPRTYVFYRQQEAAEALRAVDLPLVGKLNVGASGNGVRVLEDRPALGRYLQQIFSKGMASSTGPKLGPGKLWGRLWQKLTHPGELLNKLRTYREVAADRQVGFAILQAYVPHDFEWRAVRIGDSFFAHKKLKAGAKASGSLLKNYDNPPPDVLDFVESLTDRFGFRSVAVDLFETTDGGYLVNEIQCIFGQSDDYQMLVDGEPGRYRRRGGVWAFEPGDFARNQCYDLRLEEVLRRLAQKAALAT